MKRRLPTHLVLAPSLVFATLLGIDAGGALAALRNKPQENLDTPWTFGIVARPGIWNSDRMEQTKLLPVGILWDPESTANADLGTAVLAGPAVEYRKRWLLVRGSYLAGGAEAPDGGKATWTDVALDVAYWPGAVGGFIGYRATDVGYDALGPGLRDHEEADVVLGFGFRTGRRRLGASFGGDVAFGVRALRQIDEVLKDPEDQEPVQDTEIVLVEFYVGYRFRGAPLDLRVGLSGMGGNEPIRTYTFSSSLGGNETTEFYQDEQLAVTASLLYRLGGRSGP